MTHAPARKAEPKFEFRWRNFRGFKDTGWIEVRPVTVLLGPNDSGKTSLMIPLLLLKQTIDSADPSVSLKTTGPIASVGSFRDVVFRHRLRERVSFDVRFDYPKKQEPTGRLRRVGVYPPGIVSLEFVSGDVEREIKLRRFESRDVYNRTYVVRSLLPSGKYSIRFTQKLPTRFIHALEQGERQHFFFPISSAVTSYLHRKVKKKAGGKEKGRRGTTVQEWKIPGTVTHYWTASSITEASVSHFLAHLSYVGPLRERPRRTYESTEEIPASVGIRGENAPQILFHKKSQAFQRNIGEWLRNFGLADSVHCEPLGRGIFAVQIVGPKRGWRVDFADTGFGLSQLLPLVVEGFHSNRGDTIFVEQPEIHLNPKLQCTLANLFAAIAGDNKAVIVETHSEHLVLRLRALIAEKKVKPQDVALYYIEKRKGESFVRRIAIQEDGHIEPEEWPKGFFEDSLGEALRLARTENH